MKRSLICPSLAELLLAVFACSFDSKEAPIAYPDPTEALVVFEVQEDFTSTAAKMLVDKSLAPSMIDNINSIQQQVKAKNLPIIYVRNVFSRWDIVANLFRHGAAVQGSPRGAYDPRLNVVDGAQFTKSVPDLFSNHEFEEFFLRHHI